MNEFLKAVTDAKYAINLIKHEVARHKIDLPYAPDWSEIFETLVYLEGYLNAVSKHTAHEVI